MEALPGGIRAMAVRLFLILVLLAYSSGRYCRDRKCEQPISEAKVIKDFDDDDHKYLPVQKGEKVLVFSKADDNNYFEVEIGESRGFVPSKNLREIRMFSQESNLIQLSDVNGDDPEMDTDFVSKSKNRKRRDLVSSKAEKRSIEELHSKEHKKNPKVSDRQNLLKFVQNLEEGIQSSVHTKNSDPGVVQSAGDIKSDVDSGSTGAEDTSGGKDSMETNMDDEDVEFKGAVTAPESAAPDVDETTKHDEGSTTLEEWLKNPRFVELRERQLKDYLRSHFGEEESSPEIKNLAMELITNDLLTQLSNKGSELRRFLSEQESESEHATKEPAEGLEKTSESGVEEGHTKEIIPEQPIKSLNKGADHETTRTEGNLNPVASGNAAAVKEEERKREDSSSEESSDAGVIGSKDAVIKGMDTKDDQHLTRDDKPNDSSSLQHVPIQSEELTEADPASTDHQKKEYAASTLSDADAGQEEEKKLTEVVTDSETTSKPDHGVDDSYGSNDSNLNKDSAPTTDPNMDLDTESNKANSQSNDIVPLIQSQATGADYSGSSKVEAGVTETIHENNTDAGKRDDASYTDNESAAEQRDASQVGKEDNTPSGKMQSTITSDDKEGMNTKPTQYVSEETQAIIPSTTNDVQEKQSKGIRQEETDHVEDVSDTEQDARDTEVSENDKLLALCHEHPHLEACDALRGAKIYRGSKDVEVPEPANDDDQPSFLSGICCSIYDWITSLVKAFLLVVKAPCNLLGLGEVLDSVIIAADKTYAVSSGAMILMLVLYPLILGPLIRCFVYYRSRYRPVKMRTDIEKSYIRRAEISEENCEKYKKELARTKEAYLEQQKERVSLEQQISELRDEMEQLNKSLIAEQKIAKSNMKDLDNALKEQQVLKSLIEEKESEIATADKVAAKHQKEIEDQKSTTTSMTARLEEFQMELTLKDNEIDNLQTMLGTAEREKSKTEEIRQKLTEDIERLEERLSETNKNIDEKEQEKEKLYEQIEGKDTELEVLRGILMTINSGQNLDGETKHDYEAPEDDPDIDEQLKTERLGKLLDSTAALAQVKKLEEDNKLLTEALGEEIEAKKSLEESYDKVKREFEETSILYKEFKTKAETNEIKLVALREHFQSQENELRRKLISEESARLESQKKFDESIVDSTTAVKEVEMLRQQVLDLKNEIKDIERSKQQLETIKTMENHNLFLQSKQAKRELEEMIRERDIYRKRLLEAETVKKSSPPETRKANSEGRASPRDSVDGGRGASPSSQQSGKLSGVPPHTASLIRSPFGPVGPPPMYGGPAPMRPPPFGPMMPGPFPPGMMPQGMVPPGMPAGMPGVLPPSLPAATAGSAMIPPAFASRDSVPSGPSSLVSGSNSSGARPPLRPKTSDLSTISGQGPSFVPLRSQPPRQGPFTSTPEQRHVPPPFGSPAGIPMVPGGPVPQNGNPPQPRPPIQGPVPPSHVGTNIHTTPFTNFQSRPTNTQPNLSSGVPKTSNPFV